MDNKILEEEELLESNNDIYKCPGCGANLKYDSNVHGLKCEYCGYEFQINGVLSDEEHDFNNIDESKKWDREVHKAQCKNCGAEVIIDKDNITQICPFCSTSLVLSTDDIIGLKPDRVIPFKINKEISISNYCNWLKKKFFAPRKVKKNVPNPELYSIYVPSWTYDSDVISSYKGRLGKRYTRTVGSGKNRRTVTEIRYYRISGIHQMQVDDLLICSGKQINQEQLAKIQPYNTNDSYEFDNRYIVGHTTEHYSLEVKDGWENAKKIIDQQMRAQILRKYNYDVVDYLNLNTAHNKIKYKYVVLPVWICHYLFHKKKYHFLVNGENGKVSGKYPLSILKIILVILLTIGLIFFVAYLFANA